jgi:hypothetical protein
MELGLQGLACLASSSRQLRNACVDLVKQDAHALLLDALPAARADTGLAAAEEVAVQSPAAGAAAACQCLQPVLWILRIFPPCAARSALTAAAVLQRLVHIPQVPLQQAQQIVAGGVRIPYAQLLAAANSMVAGVEVWVQAEQPFMKNRCDFLRNDLNKKDGRIRFDIPLGAVFICCGRIHGWVTLHTAVYCCT